MSFPFDIPTFTPNGSPTITTTYPNHVDEIDLTGNATATMSFGGVPRSLENKRRYEQAHNLTEASSEADASDAGSAARKRRRLGNTHEGTAPSISQSSGAESRKTQSQVIEIEDIIEVDDGDALGQTLQKQRQEQVAAQDDRGDKPAKLSTLSCVICMESPTDLTATSCGHLFCHECLQQSLIASENRDTTNGPARAQCPVCRKTLNRKKVGRDVIPLLLMKNQPRTMAASAISRPASRSGKSKG